jgi:hypothetical protein
MKTKLQQISEKLIRVEKSYRSSIVYSWRTTTISSSDGSVRIILEYDGTEIYVGDSLVRVSSFETSPYEISRMILKTLRCKNWSDVPDKIRASILEFSDLLDSLEEKIRCKDEETITRISKVPEVSDFLYELELQAMVEGNLEELSYKSALSEARSIYLGYLKQLCQIRNRTPIRFNAFSIFAGVVFYSDGRSFGRIFGVPSGFDCRSADFGSLKTAIAILRKAKAELEARKNGTED